MDSPSSFEDAAIAFGFMMSTLPPLKHYILLDLKLIFNPLTVIRQNTTASFFYYNYTGGPIPRVKTISWVSIDGTICDAVKRYGSRAERTYPLDSTYQMFKSVEVDVSVILIPS